MKLTNGCSERAQGALNHSSVRSNAASCLLSTTTLGLVPFKISSQRVEHVDGRLEEHTNPHTVT